MFASHAGLSRVSTCSALEWVSDPWVEGWGDGQQETRGRYGRGSAFNARAILGLHTHVLTLVGTWAWSLLFQTWC